MAFPFVIKGMAFFAYLLGDGTPFHCWETPTWLSNAINCFIAAMVAGVVSLGWYVAIRFQTKRNRPPKYPAPFVYLTGSSVGLLLLGLLGSFL